MTEHKLDAGLGQALTVQTYAELTTVIANILAAQAPPPDLPA